MYFEIVPASRAGIPNGFRAHIKDGNHKLIWWTQVYKYKRSAVNACELVRAYAGDALIYDRLTGNVL